MRSVNQPPDDPEFIRNPYPFYRTLRAQGDFVFWEELEMPVAVTHEAVNSLMRHPHFGRQPATENLAETDQTSEFMRLYARSLLRQEPPDHTRLRDLLERTFSPKRLQFLAPAISMKSDQLIEAFPSEPFDLLEYYSGPLPLCVIAKILGVPCYMANQLQKWSDAMIPDLQTQAGNDAEAAADQATREFSAYLREFLRVKDGLPGQDLTSDLLRAKANGDVDEDEIVAACMMLLLAGYESTMHALGSATVSLLNYENSRSALVPEHICGTIEECLRHDPPVHLRLRYAYDDIQVLDQVFKQGDVVGCLAASACRDDAIWADSENFDPFRPQINSVVFGAGIHHCLGAVLARLLMQIALPILFSRCPKLKIVEQPSYRNHLHNRNMKSLIVQV